MRNQTAPPPEAPSQNPPLPSGNEPGDNPARKSGTDGIPAIVVDSTQARGILGTQVRSNAGEDMGRIVDVIVDRQAQARGVVIDFGGFLGVGSRQIAVAWSAIRFASQDKDKAQDKAPDKAPDKAEFLVVDFTRDQLRAAPAYKSGEQIVLLGPPPGSGTTINPVSGAGGGSSANDTTDKKPPAQ